MQMRKNMQLKRDIFISYKNDGEGNNFAERLARDLKDIGYTVFFSAHEQDGSSFPEQIRQAIEECSDFILLLTTGCIEQLKENREVDWVREEILIAKGNDKNIIPILVGHAVMPVNKNEMPAKLRFLPHKQALYLPDQYIEAPFTKLQSRISAKPKIDDFSDDANSNENFDVCDFMKSVKAKAEEKDIVAMFQMGCLCYYGVASIDSPHGCIDYSEAAKWFEAVANTDHELATKAKFMLGNMHYCGIMPSEEQSFSNAFELYEEVSQTNPLLSQEKLIFMLSDGVGKRFDLEKIKECFEKSNSSNLGKNNMAKFYINYGMFKEAIAVLESVEGVYPDAEYKLGQLYLRGLHENPPRPDVFRAEHHFRMAAENNHLDALHALGLMNFRGQFGFTKNLYKAREYYKAAAERDHRGAQYDYAWMCKYGLGGEKDIETAIRYFEYSAQKAHILSALELAILYQEPQMRNYKKAFEWALVAAEAGVANAEYILGNLYLFGRGCQTDEGKARIYYNRAKKHGFDVAEQMLKVMEEDRKQS